MLLVEEDSYNCNCRIFWDDKTSMNYLKQCTLSSPQVRRAKSIVSENVLISNCPRIYDRCGYMNPPPQYAGKTNAPSVPQYVVDDSTAAFDGSLLI